MRRRVLLIVCGIYLGLAATAGALAEKPQGEWKIPRVESLVVVNAPASGSASVDVQIVGSLTDEQAKQIVERAGSLGGWSPTTITVEHQVFKSGTWWEGVSGEKAKPEVETVAHFQAVGLVDRAGGALSVKEFLQALRDHAPVRIVYNVGGAFTFSGPDDEDFEGLRVRHYQSDGTHTFDAVPSGVQAAPAAAPAATPPAGPFPWLGVTLCVVAVALAAGAGVWKWRTGRLQHRITARRGESSGS